MTIEERRCPHCGNRRTVQLGSWGSVCFNCHRPTDATAPHVPLAVLANQVFTAGELARLENYRAAIVAGLYSDWPALSDHEADARPVP